MKIGNIMVIDRIKTKAADTFPALYYKNFRLFWTCQMISLLGTWMQNIGQSWLVLQLTGSPFKLGVVNALQFLPITLFSLFAGPLVDRFPKRRILLCTQICLMVLAVALATLTYFDRIQYWHILILALLLGLVNTVDVPTRQAFVIELVERHCLMNAIALNSTIFNLGRMVGPAIAGLLIGLLGIAMCFYINALSFFGVILGLFIMKVPNRAFVTERANIISEIRGGLSYIRVKPFIMFPLLLMAMISAFVMNYNVLIPVFAKENLSQDALGFGFLMTSIGIGSFLGALTLAVNSKKGPRMGVLFGGALGASILMCILGFEKDYWLACITLMIVGFCNMNFVASVNTTIQLHAEDSMRGRVMSVYSFVMGGVAPFGSLITGQISEVAGAHTSITVCGLIGIAAVLLIYRLFHRHTGHLGSLS